LGLSSESGAIPGDYFGKGMSMGYVGQDPLAGFRGIMDGGGGKGNGDAEKRGTTNEPGEARSRLKVKTVEKHEGGWEDKVFSKSQIGWGENHQ